MVYYVKGDLFQKTVAKNSKDSIHIQELFDVDGDDYISHLSDPHDTIKCLQWIDVNPKTRFSPGIRLKG